MVECVLFRDVVGIESRQDGGLTTKINSLVDAEGRPVRLEPTVGQAGDAPMTTKLLDAVAPGATVIADKA